MAWSEAVVTNQGLALEAAAMAKQIKMQITEIWVGDGTIADQSTATDLGHKRIQADIVQVAQQDTDCVITFRIDNDGQTENIPLKEIGFYALDEAGQTILYSSCIDPNPATLPKHEGNDPVYRQTMTMAFGYSNADDVTLNVTIVDGTPETRVVELIKLHNDDTAAHKNFVGATATTDGERGMVPKPTKEQNGYYLSSNGQWVPNTTVVQEHEDNEDAHQNLSSTIDQALVPTADKNTIRNLLSNLANMIMQTTGQDDWKKAPVKNIAQVLTMFSTLADNLEVEWTENNTKFSVPSLGISGLMAQNGYLSFGPLFGGLIIQWGVSVTTRVTFPVTFKKAYTVVAVGTSGGASENTYIAKLSVSEFVWGYWSTQGIAYWVALGSSIN